MYFQCLDIFSLEMQIQETVAPRQEQRAVEIHENEDSLLNSNDITTRVKVLTLWPSGRTERPKYILLLKMLLRRIGKQWITQLLSMRN